MKPQVSLDKPSKKKKAKGMSQLIFLPEPSNENYYKNALILLVKTHCVAIFAARF